MLKYMVTSTTENGRSNVIYVSQEIYATLVPFALSVYYEEDLHVLTLSSADLKVAYNED